MRNCRHEDVVLNKSLPFDKSIYQLIMIVMVDMETQMITETSAVAFRQNLGEMLNQVQYRHDSIVINKDGRPVAALIDARLFTRIRQMQERFDTLAMRLAEAYAGVLPEEGMAEIEQAVAEVRTEARAAASRQTEV